jgi:hypothetical protein
MFHFVIKLPRFVHMMLCLYHQFSECDSFFSFPSVLFFLAFWSLNSDYFAGLSARWPAPSIDWILTQ